MLMSLVVNLQVVVPALLITEGGPGQASRFMTYLLYHYGFRRGDISIASAMSFVFFVISALLATVIFLTSKSWIFYEGGDEK
jgi:multiple sugar transport system permease protein